MLFFCITQVTYNTYLLAIVCCEQNIETALNRKSIFVSLKQAIITGMKYASYLTTKTGKQLLIFVFKVIDSQPVLEDASNTCPLGTEPTISTDIETLNDSQLFRAMLLFVPTISDLAIIMKQKFANIVASYFH